MSFSCAFIFEFMGVGFCTDAELAVFGALFNQLLSGFESALDVNANVNELSFGMCGGSKLFRS